MMDPDLHQNLVTMNAVELRVVDQQPASGFFARPAARTQEVRRRFVNNWGRLAATFGMSRQVGRVHAQLFIEGEAVDVESLSTHLDLGVDEVLCHLGSLSDWGVVRSSTRGHQVLYATSRDPWEFFLEIVRQRHRREFMPVLELVRETAVLARELGCDAGVSARIEQFTRFVEDLSRLIDVFARVGSKPMAMVLKTVSKMTPRF